MPMEVIDETTRDRKVRFRLPNGKTWALMVKYSNDQVVEMTLAGPPPELDGPGTMLLVDLAVLERICEWIRKETQR